MSPALLVRLGGRQEGCKMKQRYATSGSFKKGHCGYGKGVPRSEETKKRIGIANSISLKGKHHSEATKLKMRQSRLGFKWREEDKWRWRGENNPAYKDGRTMKCPTRPKPEQCETCGALGKDFTKGLYYDHDHKTNKFRGWICLRCNFILGLAKDNKETLQSLIEYLKKNETII